MKKKVLSVLLSSAMVVSMAACGGSGSDSGSTSASTATSTETKTETTTAASTEASSAATEASSAEETPAEDNGLLDPLPADQLGSLGKSTTPRSNYVTYPIADASGVTLKYWMPLPSNVSKNPDTSDSVQMTEWAKRWQEMTGVTVEFIHPTVGSENEEFGTMIAGSSLPDIIEWEWTNSYAGGPSAAEDDGVLIYLNDYIQPDGPAADLWQWLQDNPHVDKEIKDDDGNYYCFPFVRGSKYLQCTSGLMYRSDLLDAAGYEFKDPAHVTMDDLTEAMRALKAYGVKNPMDQQSIANLESGTMNAYSIRPAMYVGEDGKVHYGYAEEGYKEWMKQMNAWVEEGLLNPDILTMDRSTLETNIFSGDSAICYGAGGGYMGTWLQTARNEPDTYGADFDIKAINFPTLDGGLVKYGGASYDYATTSKASAVITADCQYPEIAAAFLNFCYSQAGHYAINFGVEGETYTIGSDGMAAYTDLVMKNPDGLSIAVAMAKYGRANMSGAFVQDNGYIFSYYAEPEQKEALRIWNDESDSQPTLIPPITMTQEEANEYSKKNADVNTTVGEYKAKWFNRESDIDADWDAYIQQLNDQGLQDMIAIYQAALDRYNAR